MGQLTENDKVLITGGAGFIGSHLAVSLGSKGVSVVLFDNLSTGSMEAVRRAERASTSFEFVEGDICDAEALAEAAKGCRAIVHLAAMVSVQESLKQPVRCHEVNARGTLNALEAARHATSEGAAFVLASSAAVYGDTDEVPTDEHTPLSPLSPYGATKAEGELMCQTYSSVYGVPTTPLRFFNVFGEYQDPTGPYAAVISAFARCFTNGTRPTIYGDGRQTRDFIYVGDVVEAIESAIVASPQVDGTPINIGTGHSISLLELVEQFGEAWGSAMEPVFEQARSGDIRHSCSVVERARGYLGFRASTEMVEGLRAIRTAYQETTE